MISPLFEVFYNMLVNLLYFFDTKNHAEIRPDLEPGISKRYKEKTDRSVFDIKVQACGYGSQYQIIHSLRFTPQLFCLIRDVGYSGSSHLLKKKRKKRRKIKRTRTRREPAENQTKIKTESPVT